MDQLREFVIAGRASETIERTKALLEEGMEAEAILKQALIHCSRHQMAKNSC